MDYQAKVNELCTEAGAKHIVQPDRGPEAAYSDSIEGALYTGPLTDEDAFWTALHELGHIVHRDSQARRTWGEQHPEDVIMAGILGNSPFPLDKLQAQEALATTWALDNAGVTPSPEAAATSLFALDTYNTWDPKTGVGDPRAPLADPPVEFKTCEARLKALAHGAKSHYTIQSVVDANEKATAEYGAF